jgi:adenosine deaminase
VPELQPADRHRRHHRQPPDHRLKDLGFAVTINPDNRLMSGTSVSREMRLLVDEAGWNQTDLEWATVNAVTAAFLPLDVRERMLDEILIPGFARVTI